MKGLMTLGVVEHEYPEFGSVPGHHGDEANKAVDEIEARMQRLVDLEKRDVNTKREDYKHLRSLELEYLLADAVPYIVHHMASSIRPRMEVPPGLIRSFREISDHYHETLRVFREDHGFNTDEHHHDRRDRETRRTKRARDATGRGGKDSGSDGDEEDSWEIDPEAVTAGGGGEGEVYDEEKGGERPAGRRSGRRLPDVITVAGGGVPGHNPVGGGGGEGA
jgi:hypothetical protein